MRALLCAMGLVFGLSACDTGQEIELPPKAKSMADLKQSTKPDTTPEELKEARRKAGFKDADELAEENIAQMKKGEREYVKTRLVEHREMLATLRDLLSRVEKQAPKWPKAKNAQAAFEKFSKGYREDTAALTKVYKKLMEGGSKIDIQAKLVGTFSSFEDLNGDLGPEISAEEGLSKTLEDLRKQLDELDAELETIEKDESLVVNENYEPEGKG